MHESAPRSLPDDPGAQAAAWVLRLDRGLTPAEQDDYLAWLGQDPRHGAALARHRRNWERLNLLAQWRPEHAPRPNRDLLAPVAGGEARASRGWGRRGLAAWPLALALAVGGLYFHSRSTAPTDPAISGAVPVTVAMIEQLILDEGSRVELNRGAEVDVRFTPAERRVRLTRGEAHFQVTADPDRPFVVEAGGVLVSAIGTAFNVRLGSAEVEVLVTEGRVQVHETEATYGQADGTHAVELPLLVAGQSAKVALVPAALPVVMNVSTTEIEAQLAWQPRMLDFPATPLEAIVAEFNRRNAPYRLIITDAELAELQVSAALRSDNVEGFVRLLEVGFGVQVERAGHEIRLRPE